MTYYFVFCNKADTWWSIFSPRTYKHVYLLAKGDRGWYVLEPTFEKMEFKELKAKVIEELLFKRTETLRHVTKIIGVEITKGHRGRNIPWMIPALCSQLTTWFTGIDIGWTFNPCHLFHKLIKYDGKRNFVINYRWSR